MNLKLGVGHFEPQSGLSLTVLNDPHMAEEVRSRAGALTSDLAISIAFTLQKDADGTDLSRSWR